MRAELLAADANAAANAGDWVAAERSAREAAALDPGFPLYRIELGAALANLGRPEARAVVEQVAAEDPLPHLQLSAAALALADGDTNAALDAVTLAESRSTGEVIIDLNAAKVALAAGRRDLAVQWLAAAFSLNVELAGSDYFDDPAWSGDRRKRRRDRHRQVYRAGDETSPAVLSAFDGNAGIAEATLRAMAPSTRRDVALARVLWLMDRHPEAIALLEEAAASDNLAPDPYVYLVRYCTEARDEACVRHYRPLGLLAPEGQYVSAPNDGSTIPAPLNQRWRGLPAIYPAAVYLQEGNNDMLAPGVVVVGTP